MSRIIAAALASAALLASAEARALGPLDLGVGLVGVAGVNTLDQASPSSFQAGGLATSYPGFSGLTAGGGLALELRALGVIGVEADAIFSSDRGSGEVSQGSRKATVTIGQRAVHVPLLLKATAPLPLLRPFIVAGPELVFPLPSSAESDPPGVRAVVGADRYTMATAGVGAELKLPLPGPDLRAALSLRGSYRLGSSDDLAERATPLPSGAVILDARWRYQGLLAASLSAHF